MTTEETTTPQLTKLTKIQKSLLLGTILPILAVGVMGGVGTYSNLSHAYGKGTALGALGAGEGATAVMAMILLITTALGQSAPRPVRFGLWLLPMAAATMGATAGDGLGQTIVFALTPMAITAAAEGLAFLTRRVVIHQVGRDIEAQARAASVLKDLAYYQAVAAGHPNEKDRTKAVEKSWKLAKKVGVADPALAGDLMDVQRTRIGQSADIALQRMFTPGPSATAPALLAASADTTPALPPVSTGDVTTSRAHDATIQADTSGYPTETAADQGQNTESVRPDLKVVPNGDEKRPSMAATVRELITSGVQDVRILIDAVAARHGRDPQDKSLQATVGKYYREATAAKPADGQGAYL
ncbi:conjugal transfer protein [Streptomyces sp. NPDC005732]|uniref:conjugal transfer protein n=1 Tax=Streptomyces sp. NPDC005732 TaxID=3157057 RepID=UPI0033CA21BA